MVQFTVAASLAFAAAVFANPLPMPLSPDPAGAKNVGNGKGLQFITGQCLSNADCASTCCATLPGVGGICSGLAVSTAQGKQGCGFVSGAAAAAPAAGTTTTATASTATTVAQSAIDSTLPGAQNVGKADGSQFITGQCFSDADCASGCCAKLNGAGQCSGPAVSFANGKQGCGFVNGGTAAAAAAAPAATATASAGTSSAAGSNINTALAGSQNVGKGDGSQFITGQCLSDADCASGCCAKLKGAGQCSGTAVSFDAGKQGCGFTAAA